MNKEFPLNRTLDCDRIPLTILPTNYLGGSNKIFKLLNNYQVKPTGNYGDSELNSQLRFCLDNLIDPSFLGELLVREEDLVNDLWYDTFESQLEEIKSRYDLIKSYK